MNKILLTLLLTVITIQVTAQCKAISTWADKRQDVRKFCFYPTTLRMINFSKDESFNNLVKDIRKLKIVMADKSQSIKGLDLSKMKQDIRLEDFNDMVQMRQGKNSFTVFVKEKHEKPVGFAGIINSEDGLILVDLEGYIQPEVIQQLIEGKINLGALTKIYDLTKPENNKEKQPKK